MEIPIFYGVKGENPKEWTDQVEKYLLKIGVKDDKRIFEIARTHLLDNAKKWLENEGKELGECRTTTCRNNRKCVNKWDVEIEKVRRMLKDILSEVLKDKDQNEKIL
ncbi:hypothetical protein RhiirA1_478730 [Rhizophagus irregularis]|uniref:Uncharacterized protein n=1 Tax=Rhizophagus irregularis TaxID=588596 RepID=A0A2N0QRP0_9GLOM|nr:hypothetical protein RhiirA1_478730 [Rhizophagus irregularis]GET61947.1 hypothetical protein GLOIN_2v1815633 [Rhizophagus irregularis DAOM 181602=DAOM 197198]CAB4474375.1 unnamed protein product [Rhizophagus irregularis]